MSTPTPIFDALTAAHLIGSIDWDEADLAPERADESGQA